MYNISYFNLNFIIIDYDYLFQTCMEKFDQMSKNSPPLNVVNQCAVCKKEKVVKVEIFIGGFDHKLCSNPCFSAFKFVNKLYPGLY